MRGPEPPPGGGLPARRAEAQILVFGQAMDLPAGQGGLEAPDVAVPDRDLARMAGPVAACARRHEVARARPGCGGRGGAVAVGYHRLHQRVEPLERLVMGDVFLRLTGLDIGQRQDGRDLRHGVLMRLGRRETGTAGHKDS